MRIKSLRAFTFMELLIALTIFSIIASSIYHTMNAGIRVYRRGNVIIRDNQKLRLFFNAISQDMRNAMPYSEENNNFYIESEWLSEKIAFPTIINVFADEGMVGELAKVSYYMDKEARGGNRLIRKCATVEYGFDEEVAEEEMPLEGLEDFTLEGLTFQYCYEVMDEYDWRKGEEFEDGMPQGVRIELALKNKANKDIKTHTQTVFIPMGELGSDIK